MNNHRRIARRGFTILELLIVIGILLAIGSLVLVNVLGASEKADVQLTRVQLDTFEDALDRFRVEMKRLAVLWSKDAIANDDDKAKYGEPYLKEPKPKDTWGSEWIYRAPSTIIEGANYDIVSIGPDKQEGTEDDITNHDGRKDDASGEFSDFAGSSGSGGSGGSSSGG
jgi:general secretion pathway protein G